MCNYCNNIVKVEEYRKIFPPWKRKNVIAIDKDGDYGLWIECEDSYYSGIPLYIDYCPICGRNLYETSK